MYAFRPDDTTPHALQRSPVEPQSASNPARAVRPASVASLAAVATGSVAPGYTAKVANDPTAKPSMQPLTPEPETQLTGDAPIGLTRFQRFTKRTFDLASIVVILALFWWAIIAVWIAVRITTGSPVIYGHERVGRGGREFKCYKFRSMVPNADEVLAHLLATNAEAREEWARDFKLRCDPRITKVGRFIRKTSLDEFPQLWNVLMNDMSIVGPRPVVRKELDLHYTGSWRSHYLSVKPGLTGLWQVSGRNDMAYSERVELDRTYVVSWNVFSDFMIVMRTVGVMFGRRGAY